jgi:hypothetical protein
VNCSELQQKLCEVLNDALKLKGDDIIDFHMFMASCVVRIERYRGEIECGNIFCDEISAQTTERLNLVRKLPPVPLAIPHKHTQRQRISHYYHIGLHKGGSNVY